MISEMKNYLFGLLEGNFWLWKNRFNKSINKIKDKLYTIVKLTLK